jgi:hypothetical protein
MIIKHLVFSYSSNKYRIYGTFVFFFSILSLLLIFSLRWNYCRVFWVILPQPNHQLKTSWNNTCWGGLLKRTKTHYHQDFYNLGSSRQPREQTFGMQPYLNWSKLNMGDNLNYFENERWPQFVLNERWP